MSMLEQHVSFLNQGTKPGMTRRVGSGMRLRILDHASNAAAVVRHL